MAILTHQMKTARKDYMGANCKFFLPMNDSSSPFTELVSGATIADASATYNQAHAPTMLLANADPGFMLPYTVPSSGAIVLVLMTNVVTAAAFTKLSVGEVTSGPRLTVENQAGPAAVYHDGTAAVTVAGSTSAGNGVDSFQASVLNIDANTLDNYSGIGTGNVAVNGTQGDVSARTVAGTIFPANMTINVSTRQDTYGAAMFHFLSGVPSDLVTGLQWMRDQWQVGHKVLYPTWKSLA